jgi:hypothetical protein
MKSIHGLLVVGSLATTGCANIEVHGPADDTAKYQRLGGIPFYVKVPVWTQTTRRVSGELHLQLQITELEGAKAKRVVAIPPGAPLRLASSATNREAIRLRLQTLVAQAAVQRSTYEEAVAAVRATLDALSTSYPPFAGPLCDAQAPVVSNSWSIAMVTGPRQHLISTRQPLFGSSESKFTFGPDGTLGEASQKVADETAKTLLGLLPITDKLKLNWGITPPPTLAQNGKKPVQRTEVQIEVDLVEVLMTFVLQRSLDVPTTSASGAYQPPGGSGPLSLSNACEGKNSVQLVAVTVTSGNDTSTPKKPSNEKAYVIEGTIKPPKDDKKAEDAGNTDPAKGPITK